MHRRFVVVRFVCQAYTFESSKPADRGNNSSGGGGNPTTTTPTDGEGARCALHKAWGLEDTTSATAQRSTTGTYLSQWVTRAGRIEVFAGGGQPTVRACVRRERACVRAFVSLSAVCCAFLVCAWLFCSLCVCACVHACLVCGWFVCCVNVCMRACVDAWQLAGFYGGRSPCVRLRAFCFKPAVGRPVRAIHVSWTQPMGAGVACCYHARCAWLVGDFCRHYRRGSAST